MKQQIEGLRSGFLTLAMSVIMTGALSACAIKTVNRGGGPVDPDQPPATNDLPTSVETTQTPAVKAPPVGLFAPVEDPSQISEPTIKLVRQAPATKAAETISEAPPKEFIAGKPPAGVPGQKALGWLKNGNSRFLKGFVRKDGQSLKDIQKISKQQVPHSLIVACSDSRMPPEILFDQKLGEVYVIRTPAVQADAATVANIETALLSLDLHLLVILGHNSCGAVNEVSQKLAQQSTLIQEKITTGDLVVKSAVYDLTNGKVAFEP